MTHLLAIDQGTTNTKAVLVSADGRVGSVGSAPIAVSHPQPGWVEQDPDLLWSSVLTAVHRCLEQAQASAKKPAGVALSTQRESVLAWHRGTGEPLGPVIGWQDVRTADWCRNHTDEVDDELVRSRTGLRIDAMFSAPKIGWLLRAAAATTPLGDVCVGTVDSWLIHRLTGGHRHVTEAGNASRTLLYDVVDLGWSQSLLELFEIPVTVLPRVEPSNGDFGATLGVPGLDDATPILAVMADSHAALYGHGCTEIGTAKATYGTGTSVMTPTEAFVPGFSPVPSTLAWLTDTATYAREGNILSSGATLAWTAKLLQLSVPELLDLAATVPSARAVTLLPAFTGLGAPHWNRDVRGVITNLDPDTDRGQLARAAVDAVAHQVCDVVDVIDVDSPTPLAGLRADGGATASPLLMQTQADLLGRPVAVADLPQVSALGVADLAWRRLGRTPPARPAGKIIAPTLDPATRSARRDHWRQQLQWLQSRS
jgi:glycerol kinase